MTDHPIVSFVMPAYNVELYIEKAITSVIQQTVSAWRLIIVDDGSADDTLRIAREYACRDNRISVFSMPSPSGSAYQPRKKAIQLADTKYVAPIDADDWIEPNYLAKMLDLLSVTDAEIIYPTMYLAPITTSPERLVPREDWVLYDQSIPGADCIKYTLDGWRIGCNGGILVKYIYEQAFLCLPENISYAYADELLTRYLLLKSKAVVFSEAKYFYRKNETSITHRISFNRFTLLYNNLSLLDLCSQNFGTESAEYLLAQRQNFHGIFDAYRLMNNSKLTSEDKKSVLFLIEQCRKRVDVDVIKAVESPRYVMLFRQQWLSARICLKIIDQFIAWVKAFMSK